MPYYDYACGACSHTFTVRRGFHDDVEESCPECGASAQRRLSLPAIVYKGSGFYTTDYGGRRVPAASGTDDSGRAEPSFESDGEEGGHDRSEARTTPTHDLGLD